MKIFTNVDECIDFMTDIEEEQIFMVISGTFNQVIVRTIHDMAHIHSVYIFYKDEEQHEQWTKELPKVKGVFTDFIPICEALKYAAQECNQNSVSLSFVKTIDVPLNQSLDQLDQSFMYTQILKEILLTIDFEQSHIDEFLTYCREQLVDNLSELRNVDKFEKEYRHQQPIWWYTHQGFLYFMLNRALRLMEVDLIIKIFFFLQDLHNDITALHSEQFGGSPHSELFTVYRGQGLSQTDFNELKKTQGGLLSFNNFLSTSLDRAVSLAFAESNQDNPTLMGIIFQITIDPSMSSTSFAHIHGISAYQTEEEILFSMHSIFRIGQVTQIDGNTRLWQVDLTLTSDNDLQLLSVTERIRGETFPEQKRWYRLGNLLVKLGQLDHAQQVFDIMLDQASKQREKAGIYHMLGMVKTGQGNYAKAIEFFEKSIEICQKILPSNHPDLAATYSSISLVYDSIGECLKCLKALSYYEKVLEICQTTLPRNHPDLATSYNNIGLLYNNIGEHFKALLYYEKAREIREQILPSNHPSLATSYNNIGNAYHKIGEQSKALLSLKKTLQIREKILPANHPDLGTSYNNIGAVYSSMGEYSKALSYYGKDLEISQKTLSPNHPTLATSYNNVGEVYVNIREYSKALSYYEKALEIWQKTLPPNHPNLAIFYSNIGVVYSYMGKYSKSLTYYEPALNISQRSLPPNHPDLQSIQQNIVIVKKNL